MPFTYLHPMYYKGIHLYNHHAEDCGPYDITGAAGVDKCRLAGFYSCLWKNM